MAVVYYYVPVEKANDVVECGLKLSEWKDREQQTPGVTDHNHAFVHYCTRTMT